MKRLKLLLIFAIFGYCFMDSDIDECKVKFEDLLKEKCEVIGSCTYDSVDRDCVETRDCSTGNTVTCSDIHPINFHTHKCELAGTRCEQKEKLCSDYNLNGISGDNCTLLVAPDKDEQRCLPGSGTSPCKAHYNDCTKIRTNTNNECSDNIPNNPLRKCVWNDNTCSSQPRNCGESPEYYDSITVCTSLPTTDNNIKKCIYKDGSCAEEYINCEERSVSFGSQCEHYMPLNANQDNYDYTKYCTKDTSISRASGKICKPVNRKCTEYNKNSDIRIPDDLLSEELCGQLEVTENYKRCAYNEKDKKCYEEYKTCEDYITNKVETDKSGCEKIVLSDKTKKCVYIEEKDECQTRNIYSNCADYTGNDKYICESIVQYPNNRSYCILDKDKECIEKSINCSETTDKDICLNIAKASQSNKRCAYDTTYSKCYEEYIRCEDYIENTQTSCSGIKLYNGKKCKSESISSINGYTSVCRSDYKICKDTKIKEECKLMAITGVSDPDRKVCDYSESSSTCFENYKYCSDYRGNNPTFCENIKPYDELGNNIDIRYKCEYKSYVGCHRVPVDCEDADENPILCEEFSQYIKDNDKKYCLFYGGKCTTQYQQCEYVDQGSSYSSKCSNNIIKGRIRNVCRQDSDRKCVTKKECDLFEPPIPYDPLNPTSLSNYYKEICENISLNCTFNRNGECIFEEKTCEDINFYTDDEKNKQICENMEVSIPYKKCALKEDKTGCEIVYRELNYSTTYISYSTNVNDSNQENSSNDISKRIPLIIILLCLLI